MTKKIAVLVNENTMEGCSCGGCLKAFVNKNDAFSRYEGEEIELIGFRKSNPFKKMVLLQCTYLHVCVVKMINTMLLVKD